MSVKSFWRLVVGALLSIASGWALYWLVAAERPVVAVLGALAVLFAYAPLLAWEVAYAAVVNRKDSTPRPSARQWIASWSVEVVTDLIAFGWWQPFRSEHVLDVSGATSQRRGVVLIPGLLCNRGVWLPWSCHWNRSIPCVAVDVEGLFRSIDTAVPALDRAVRQLREITGLPPVLVAHSMGGLIVRAWLASGADVASVHRIITVATPHQGTQLSRWAPAGTNLAQMQRGSAWLRSLRAREPVERSRAFTCFYSHCDNVVVPASSAMLPGADNRHVPGQPHLALLYHPDVRAEVERWLEP